jgi:hypothetical protein
MSLVPLIVTECRYAGYIASHQPVYLHKLTYHYTNISTFALCNYKRKKTRFAAVTGPSYKRPEARGRETLVALE